MVLKTTALATVWGECGHRRRAKKRGRKLTRHTDRVMSNTCNVTNVKKTKQKNKQSVSCRQTTVTFQSTTSRSWGPWSLRVSPRQPPAVGIWMCLRFNRKWTSQGRSFGEQLQTTAYRCLCVKPVTTGLFHHRHGSQLSSWMNGGYGPVMRTGWQLRPRRCCISICFKALQHRVIKKAVYKPEILSWSIQFMWTGTQKKYNQRCVYKLEKGGKKAKLYQNIRRNKTSKTKEVIINKSYGMFQWHHIQVIFFKSLIISGSCKHWSQ